MNWDCWNERASAALEVPECEHEPCEFCGICHVVGCRGFQEACDSFIPECVLCGGVILSIEPKEAYTYPYYGWMHKACANKADEQQARDQRAEMEAERRNEMALYGYELPPLKIQQQFVVLNETAERRTLFDGEWYYPQYWEDSTQTWEYYEDGSGPVCWYEG